MTLIFSPTQALLAAKAGARFVSPFVGRLDDIATPGMELVADIVQIFDNYDFDCEVLAASLRHPMHVVEAAQAGRPHRHHALFACCQRCSSTPSPTSA